MESSPIVDPWNTFKDSIDKKQIEIVAESFVDTCADYGAQDLTLEKQLVVVILILQ